jgi:hypothetical protein
MTVGHLSCRRGKEGSRWPWKKKMASVIPLSRTCRDTKKSGQSPDKNAREMLSVKEGKKLGSARGAGNNACTYKT